MKVPFKTKKQEEVENVNEEKEEKLATREELKKLSDKLDQRIEANERAIATLTESSGETEDEANLAEEISRLREGLEARDKEIAKLSDGRAMAEKAVAYLRELPAEEKVEIVRELGFNVAEATEEDKARVADETSGSPDMIESLDNVANPDNYLYSEGLKVYVKVK